LGDARKGEIDSLMAGDGEAAPRQAWLSPVLMHMIVGNDNVKISYRLCKYPPLLLGMN
jgi:hypothetical protein